MLMEIEDTILSPEELFNKYKIVIIGNGDIASALFEAIGNGPGAVNNIDTNQVPGLVGNRLYFASGVSNPNDLPETEYQREKDLLLQQRRGLQIVYFSSLSVLNPQKRYAYHKLEMEKLIQISFPKYAIARVGIITWGTNPHTTVNFLRGKVERGEKLTIRDTTRDVVEKDEFIRQVNALPWENNITEIHGTVMTELEIFRNYVSSSYPIPKIS